MRESIGATWIFSICLTFIILFTAYLAISVNYAKAFRIKSHIISMIEESEGYRSGLDREIENYLTAQGYSASGSCDEYIENQSDYRSTTDWQLIGPINYTGNTDGKYNACVYRLQVTTNNDDIDADRAYYKVVVFFKFDLPIVNYLTTFPVSGESKLVYDFAY